MRLRTISPSSELVNINLGEVFVLGNNKRYMLISRDPWTAKIARYTKIDEFFVNLIDRFKRKKR